MKNKTERILNELIEKYPKLDYLEERLRNLIEKTVKSIRANGKILVCGNGGSASDSEHIVGELLKKFYIDRPIEDDFKNNLRKNCNEYEYEYMSSNMEGAIPAISLVSQTTFLTAYGNDVNFDMIYAQQVYAYGNENDILIALSTSGNSSNVYYAAKAAKSKGMMVISLTGEDGGKLKSTSDILLNVPLDETYQVQEYHLPLYHFICRALEYEIFGG